MGKEKLQDLNLKIEYIDPHKLKPYKNNTRKHAKFDVEEIVKSITDGGFNDPIGIWGPENLIVEGHGRQLAAIQMGMEKVPCIRLDHMDDNERKEYAIRHNRTAELSEWDNEVLKRELADLLSNGIDLSDLNFEEIDEDLKQKDKVVEVDPVNPPEKPKAQRGEIYQLGRHRLMCGDSTSIEDVNKLVNGTQIDMLLTDPPYNVDIGELNKSLIKYGKAGRRTLDDKLEGIKNDKMHGKEFIEFLCSVFSNANTVLKPGATFHIWYSEIESYSFRLACMQSGLTVRQQLIWVKNNMVIGRQDFQRQYEAVLTGDNYLDDEMEDNGYEPCLYGWTDGKGHNWYKKRKEKDVLFFDKPRASAEHPTMKPILLFDYEMQCNTKNGDAVLDLFSGSGTTIMACEQNGRVAYAMELDPRFVDAAIARWEKFTGKKAVLVNE